MSLETDMRTYLLTKTALTALLGVQADATASVCCQRLPQSATLPAVVISRVSGTHDPILSGAGTNAEARMQCDVFATGYVTAKAVRDQLDAALRGYRGTWGSTTIDSVIFDNEIDADADLPDGSDSPWTRIITDYRVLYQETAI